MTSALIASAQDPDEAEAWRSLDLVLAWLAELVGFQVASVNVVRGDQLQVIALSGVERGVRMDGSVQLAEEMLGATWPVEELLLNLERADDWGRFKFIPHDRAVESPNGWLVAASTISSTAHGPDAWHEEDVLVAPLYDDEGTLIGCLSVDDPRDGRRPDSTVRHLLDEYAAHVNLSLLHALQRSRLVDRARMLDETRVLVRALSETPDASLAATRERIALAFDADTVVLHTLGEDSLSPDYNTVVPANADGLVQSAMLAERARAAWERRTAYSTTGQEFLASLPPGTERDAALQWMRTNAIGSVLFVPMGAGTECLGSVVLARRPERAPWTEQHREAARQFGLDLGRVLHARRVLQRERRLVAAQQDLDHAKSQLIAAVSRELTLPLDAIGALAHELDATALDHRALGALYRESHRVERVIDDLLMLSRLSDPDVAMPEGTLDLVAVARDTMTVVEAARGAAVILRLHTLGNTVLVAGSPAELERALVRLVAYALACSSTETPVFVRVQERGTKVQVVIDGGADLAGALPLSERSPSAIEGGELALAIAHTIVRRHGGHLEMAEERQGVGFRVTLPLQRP